VDAKDSGEMDAAAIPSPNVFKKFRLEGMLVLILTPPNLGNYPIYWWATLHIHEYQL